jgi:hypothetical protein
MRVLRTEFWMGLALAAVVGCTPGTPPAETTAAPAPPTRAVAASPTTDAPPIAEAPQAAAGTLSGDEIAKIEELPEADRGAALAQKVCPVSQENLGSMGAPIKKVVNGRTVFVCCKGCVKELEEDPEAFLAKLKP